MRIVVQSKCKMLQGIDWQSTVFIYWVFILLQKLRILLTLSVIVRSEIMIVMMMMIMTMIIMMLCDDFDDYDDYDDNDAL